MPVGASLDCLDKNFHIVVVDRDYIATTKNSRNPSDDEGSSNVVTCSSIEMPGEYFDCSVHGQGVPGRYMIKLTLKRSLTTILGDMYVWHQFRRRVTCSQYSFFSSF